MAAYIPTNLISITDGQIYLSPKLFELGVLSTLAVGWSVSRVGSKAQLPDYSKVAGSLKLAYAQFEKLENFARFGTRLDDNTRKILIHGQRIHACLEQPEHELVPATAQISLLQGLVAGKFDDVPLGEIRKAEQALYITAGFKPSHE